MLSDEPAFVLDFFLARFIFEVFFLLAFLRVAFFDPGAVATFLEAFFVPAFLLEVFFLAGSKNKKAG